MCGSSPAEGLEDATLIILKYGNRPLSVEEMIQRAEAGDAEAAYHAGDFYRTGMNGTTRSEEKAVRWLLRGVDMGSADAMWALGVLHLQKKEYTQAEAWLLKAHAAGDSLAAGQLADIYQERGQSQKSLRWREESRDIGDMGKVAAHYLATDLSEADAAKYLGQLRRSYAYGSPPAGIELALLYATGRYVPQDRVKACRILTDIAGMDRNIFAPEAAQALALLKTQMTAPERAQAAAAAN